MFKPKSNSLFSALLFIYGAVVHKQKMRYLLNLFLILPLTIFSQTKELDFEYFLYGINHCYFEYSGRKFRDGQVDIFFEQPAKEDIIAEYLQNKIKKDSIDYIEIKRIDRGPNFKSNRGDNLSQYYLYSKSIEKGLNINFSKDSVFIQKIKTKLGVRKANSFITGAFLRNGYKINDTIYKISIYVSSKPEHCYSILKETKSSNIVFDKTYQQIKNKKFNPTSSVYFNPSLELKNLLAKVDDVPNIMERFKMNLSDLYINKISSTKGKKERNKMKKEFTDFKLRFDNDLIELNKQDIKIVERLLKQKVK